MNQQADLGNLLNSYFEAYQSTTKLMADLVAWPLSQNNLSFEQFLILRRIAMADQVTLNDIASQRQVTRSAISRQIKALLSQEYIFQVPDPQDRRRLYLHLTASGERIEQLVDQAISEHFDAWVQQLGTSKVNQAIELLQTISSKVDQVQQTAHASQLHYHH
ncbi:MarR family winged helix-turn-helix transcriptional regulator [Lactiplantibacillus daowaiensis]|uniref:MarR family winged helix-turn-helix transcriptional regulator n=1 Tax=Lactiplantibacillus daowaiensis TaxID=2559918 RepID=A0ABW1S077_9LACO|nr:MarR family transcriptional regulator [Lactiplantibacillus daowaiensis]